MNLKQELKMRGIAVDTFESEIGWEEFKLNPQGLIPVVVQDYKTSEVLMVAYMNQEAFDETLKDREDDLLQPQPPEPVAQGGDIRPFSVCEIPALRLRQ